MFIQYTRLPIICQPHQVDISELANRRSKVCTCKNVTTNEGRIHWCYCHKCKKRVCLCCSAKDHHIHNHHMVDFVTGMSFISGSYLREFWQQGKVSLKLYIAVSYVLHGIACYSESDIMVCSQQEELVCLILHELVCLQHQEMICLVQQGLIRLKQLELVCIILHGLVWFKKSCLKQQGIINLKQELICLILHGLDCLQQQESIRLLLWEWVYLQRHKLICLVQKGLIRLHVKLPELICLVPHELVCLKVFCLGLIRLKQLELVCIILHRLVWFKRSYLKQQVIVNLKQELICLMESICLVQQGLVCLQRRELISLLQQELMKLKCTEPISFILDSLVCLKEEKLFCTVQQGFIWVKKRNCLKLQWKLICIILHGLDCLQQQELICLIKHRLVCLQRQQLIYFAKQGLIRLKQLELICLILVSLQKPALIFLIQQGLVWFKKFCMKQQGMVKELICLILHRLVCLQLQESICLVQQELIRLKQLELICITLHGLVCLKQEELYCVVQVWSFLKQQGIFNPLVCFILHGLGFGKQEKLFCAVQQGLVWLKKSHWKLQQELICLILHVLDYLQQQETICLVQNELVCLNHSCMKQQGLVYLLQEPMCLILHGLVCLQLELMCLIQKGLICLVQHKLICIKQFGLVRLPHQELMYFVQLGLVSLELTTCTVTASPQQQQLLCMKQELLCLKDLHIVEYITKNFSLIDIQCHNVNEPDNKVCKFVHKVRNGSDHVCLCGLIIALFLGTGETVRIKDQDCNPADAAVPDASIIPLYHFALKNVRVTQIDDIQYNHGIASYVHYRNSYEKYKTRLKNAHFDLQQDSCLGLQLYGSILKRKNVLSANILLCTPSVEIGGKMMLHVDVAVEVTIWNSSRIGSVWKFESFQHFEYILFSKQVLKVADSLPCTMETECTMATENTNTKMFCKDIQCQIDIPTDETHCTLVVSATKSAPFCWSSHHELVVTRISSFDLMMKSDISRPVGKGSDPHASHPNKHQQQKDFTSVEADGRRTSAVGYQAAAAIEYHKKSQTGVNNDMSSSVHGNLDCDVVPDSRTKCSSQCQKDSQLWITPEGLSLNEDQNQLHTKVVPDCEVKHKFDATTSIIGQDVVKDGKGAADSSTLLQPAVTVGNSFAFNSTNGITQNVVKDGRGAVETKPIALLPSTSSVNSSLSAKMPAAQKTVVKSSTVSKAHDSGPQLIKTLPTEADHLPPLGLQYNVLYDTNARDEVPLAQDEKSGSVVKQKVDKTIRKHYQKDFPSTTQHKNSAVKNNTSKTGVQKPPFPKRCCIVAGNKMFTLDPNLLAHPHMDTYFVKERTETRPGHFLARLVLHHVYLDK